MEHRASHDDLTGLHNRAAFYEHLPRALARAGRRGSKVALLCIDLDDFKLVNDSFGHQEGDGMLREAAQRLKGCLRASEMAARIGGDEFAAVLEDVADADAAVRMAERFHERLRVPFHTADRHRVYTSASIGIALGAREQPRELVRAADLAAYEAGRRGKGRSAVFDPEARGGAPTSREELHGPSHPRALARASTRTSVSTTRASNCRPASCESSRSASAGELLGRKGLPLSITS